MAGESFDECAITASAPRMADDLIHWSGTFEGDQRLRVKTEFTSLGRKPKVTARPWLLGFLPIAMRSGRSRVVVQGGPIDQGTLDGLMEWQELHHHWWPKSTKIVDIRADIEKEPKIPARAASVACFSGGVDSAFTLLRHSPLAPDGPYRQSRLSAALMVHGFDIPDTDDEHFPEAFARTSRMLVAHGVTPLRMKTNLRRVGRRVGLGWGKVAHGPALACVLACVEQAHDRVLIPSSYPYRHLMKWGSSPLGDPLWGSTLRAFWHDGAAHDKLDKVMAIATDPAIAADLRVCFMGAKRDANCGTCFKCRTTQACFWLAGVEQPAAFPRRMTLDELSDLELSDPYKLELGRRIVREARRRDRPDIETAVKRAVDHAVEMGTQ